METDATPTAEELAALDGEYESTVVEQNQGVMEGKFQFKIERAYMAYTKENKTPMLCLMLRCIGPSFVNKCRFINHVLTPDRLKYVKQDLHVLEYKGKLSEIGQHVKEFIGVTVEAYCKQKGEYENTYLNKKLAAAVPGEPLPAENIPF